ncbi:MAG: hypothetical protein U9O94_04645 [Nanoarchaeota archaeon]|nr:hypothetical protein [Nanoarchaeota archaeon]
MPKFKAAEECYDSCQTKGFFEKVEDTNIEKIKSNLKIAEEDLASAKDAVKKERWNSAYKLFYDVLHILVESYLCFDKMKSLNHQCLFAYLCIKHSQLELSWEFFEKIRTKRNGINYYGQPVSYEDWKAVELQFSLYISALKKEIGRKLAK